MKSVAKGMTTHFDNSDESILSSNTKIIWRAINVSTFSTEYHNRNASSDILVVLVVLGAEIVVVGGLSVLSGLGLVGRQCRLRRNCVIPVT